MPEVSIIVRSMNDIPYIRKTMEAIRGQNFQDFEIVNVDSGSTDGTWEIINELNAGGIVYQIEPSSYIPGKVLNEAIRRSSGNIIVFNNSDCIPQNTEWLEKLIAPLSDPKTAASFGNQIPRPDANILVKKDHERAYGTGEISALWKHFFSLATSAVRREMITGYPFDERVQYSEDIEWSWRMKKLGFKLQYVSDSIVEHSHNYTIPEIRKRFYGEGKAEGFIYGYKTRFFKDVLITAGRESLRDIVYLLKRGMLHKIPWAFTYRYLQRASVHRGNSDYFRETGASL